MKLGQVKLSKIRLGNQIRLGLFRLDKVTLCNQN
jgi:hypothetical protein